MEGPLKLPWPHKEVSQLKEVIHGFQGAHVSQFGRYQRSAICINRLHGMCRLGDCIKQCRNMKMLNVGPYENRHVLFKEKYRRTSRRRASCVEGVR